MAKCQPKLPNFTAEEVEVLVSDAEITEVSQTHFSITYSNMINYQYQINNCNKILYLQNFTLFVFPKSR